ncbi:MAG: recombination protein RecR [Chloroflexi bacterium]|nr:recombination protein RecR [Chloroflexota bacterium]MBP8060013.1 recombination protein RecR [Chloroflexota bacterium]
MATNVLPRSVNRLINELSRLPGIGPKTASRLTFYLLRSGNELATDLAAALNELKTSTRLCSICWNITEEDPCPICADPNRDATLLCVVEEPLDMVALERTRAFRGRYHVLHGAISPVEGIGPEDLKVAELIQRLEKGGVREIIVATNVTLEGDSTALYLQRRLASYRIKMSRLARGLPMGGDLEYTDELTLSRALDGRQEMQ